MPARFTISFHELPPHSSRASHWDLFLERGDELQTWALSEEPRLGATMGAERLANHRRAYLDYEGPVSGDRGAVARFDSGIYEIVVDEAERFEVLLEGKKLCCRVRIAEGVASFS